MRRWQASDLPAAALLVAAGGAGGFLAGALLSGPAPAERAAAVSQVPAAGDAGSEELAALLAELRHAVDRFGAAAEQLARLPGGAPASAAPARVAASAEGAPAPFETGELAAAMRELASALRSAKRSSSPALEPPAHVDRVRAFAPDELLAAVRAKDHGRQEELMARLRQELMFSSPQQALDRFGRPDNIYVSETRSTWQYRLPDGAAGWHDFSLVFHDGVLITVDYDHDE